MANLADIRYGFMPQLQDPKTRNAVLALTNAETGGQGPGAQQAFLETLFNRATARGQTLPEAVYDRNYYPKQTYDAMRRGVPAERAGQLGALLDAVLGGSDLTKGGTGNASGNVMFAGGPQTFASGGERFGVEGPDRGWQGKAQPAPNPYGPEGLNEVGKDGLQPLSLMKFGNGTQPAVPAGETGGGTMSALGGPKGDPSAAGLMGAAGTQNAGGLNPLVMMGLGMLTSAAAGSDYSKGMMQGADAAQGFERNRLANLKSERDWQLENAKLPLELQRAQQALQLGQLNIDQAKRQFVPNIGADAYGMPVPGFIDPVNMKVYGLNGQPLAANGMGGVGVAGGGATGPTAGGQPPDWSKTGDEFLATLPAPLAREFKAYGEGKAVMSPAEMRTPRGEAKMRMLLQAYPDYDYTAAPARMALRKSYEGGGKQYQELQAIGTVAGHMHDLMERAKELDNWDGLSVFNAPMNKATEAVRGLKQDPRVDRFNAIKMLVSEELGKAYRGGQVTEGQVKAFNENFHAAQTPAQLKAIIGDINTSLASKRRQLEDGYRTVMGSITMPEKFTAESERSRKLFEDIDAWSKGISNKPRDGQAQEAPHPAAAAKEGEIVDGALFGYPGERYKRTANGLERVK